MQQTGADRAEEEQKTYTHVHIRDTKINKTIHPCFPLSLLPLFVSTTCQPLLICKPGRKKLSAAAAAALPFYSVGGARISKRMESHSVQCHVRWTRTKNQIARHQSAVIRRELGDLRWHFCSVGDLRNTQYAQINSSYGIAFSKRERVNKAPMQNILALQNVQNHFSIGLHARKPVSVHGLAIRVNIIKAHDSRGELSSRANTSTLIYPLFRRAETPAL